MRFDNIKSQYLQELTPLTERREALLREISELKASRNAFLEETTILNARNEELASLNAQYTRRVEPVAIESATSSESGSQDKHEMTKPPPPGLNVSSTSSTVAFSEESIVKVSKPEHSEAPASQFKPKFITMKWGASKAPKEHIAISWPEGVKRQTRAEHTFQQTGVLRVSRCDHCGDKMWGSQLRCQGEKRCCCIVAD